MAKFENKVNVHDDAAVANWISQIKAGETTYDIATHHSIKFVEGGEETTWNGLTDLTVVIPTIEDIVQTPIEFAGTVGADGAISWNDTHKDGPKTGYLVFFTADCKEFTEAKIACEAGDMAIYDGSKWNVVSGENQVELVGNTDDNNKVTVAVGAASDVLTVEGKTLTLTLDYADINNHVSKERKGAKDSAVTFNTATVNTTYVNLVKGDDTTKEIGETVTLQKASKLKSDEVKLEGINTLVTDVNWGTFNAGALQEVVLNSDDRTFNVTGGSLTKTEDEHFVTGVTLGKVTFGTAEAGDGDRFELVNGITAGSGQAFVTGVNGNTKFTVAGCLQPTDGETATYVKGITGNYVTDINAGSFTLASGSTSVATGFTTAASTGDVLSNVNVTTSTTDVFSSATVNDHVLSFGISTVVNSVGTSVSYKSLVTEAYTYTPSSAVKEAFETAGFTKASDVEYTFDTANETTYTTTNGYYKLTTPELGISKGGYALSNASMVANVSAGTFAVNVSGGALPSLGTSTVVRGAAVTGTVGTELEYVDQTVNALKENSITMPGVYTLSNVDGDGAIAVGTAGDIKISATVDLSAYLTDVTIA